MRDIRVSIAAIVLCLISIGIVMIYSSSGIYALQEYRDATYFLNRHLLFLALGFVATTVVMAIDYRDFRKYAKPLFIFGLVMLVLVLIPGIGKASYGARRWFKIGSFSFQPSEFMKLIFIIYISDFIVRKQNKMMHFKEAFLPVVVMLAVVCALIIKQPDLGNSVLIAVIVMIMLYIGGTNLKFIYSMLLLTIPGILYLVIKVPYRMRRIVAFLNPWEDSQGIGFQLTQSQIALGSGGLFGVGLGKSMQKLFFLPAAHTDFILSIIGEEFGLIGTMTVVILFGAFIWQGARLVKRISDPFGFYIGVGIMAMLGIQAVVNIGVSIGALPTKGLPLPFVSYGGSALIFNMMAVGLLLNISRIHDL